ncbi:MAG: hypothetical protein ABI894_07655 [Ilumatobacteraceae bacterium]
MSSQPGGARSLLGTIVGWVLVAVVVVVLFNFIIGAIFWLVRAVLIVALLIGLLLLYLHVKSPD